ncbi:MAG: hypothetical protein RIQ81_539 [Pseudomonadota bacterium]
MRRPAGKRILPTCRTIGALGLAGTWLGTGALANVIGNDTQNFNPTTNGLDFVTVQSSETLDPGIVNLGLFLNQARNTLPRLRDKTTNQFPANASDRLLGMDLNAGVGISENWDVGVSLPQILDQKVDDKESPRGQFSDRGNTEVRVNTKYRLHGTDDGGVALAGSVNFNRLKDNPYAGKDGSPTFNVEVIGDTTWNQVSLALNVGYRWREQGDEIKENSPIDPLGNQWIASTAASYRFSEYDTKLIAEIYTSRPVVKAGDNSNRASSAGEMILGAKHDLSHNLAIHGGLGTELVQGISSPDLRIYAGVNWTFGPEFKKDTAPSTPEEATTRKPAKTKIDPFSLPPKSEEKIVVNDLLFAFDSDREIVNDPHSILDRLVNHLKKGQGWKKLIIDGYTDNVGDDRYNLTLSYRRASNIRDILIKTHKLEANKITAIGHGEEKPIAKNNNYQGRRLNRRVEFRIFR